MSSYYILIPEIEVIDCNLETSYISVSFPLTAVAGLADKLVREIRASVDIKHIQQKSFTVCIHSFQQYVGISKNPLAFEGSHKNQEKIVNPPIIEEVKGSSYFSLVLEVVTNSYDTLKSSLENFFASRFLTFHFAGGNIISFKKSMARLYTEIDF